jgi:hypothetical protein
MDATTLPILNDADVASLVSMGDAIVLADMALSEAMSHAR